MTKALLFKEILLSLEQQYESAVNAATQAHATATHKENIAENKYDTLGLEAAYLAQGQQRRVQECESDLAIFKELRPLDFTDVTAIDLGALLRLMDEEGQLQTLFLSPVAGGLKICYQAQEVTLITPFSPLGAALLKQFSGDEVTISIAEKNRVFSIEHVA